MNRVFVYDPQYSFLRSRSPMLRKNVILLSVFILVLVLSFSTGSSAFSGPGPVNIGIVRDGPMPRFDKHFPLIVSEIEALVGDEFDVRFPKGKNIHGNWSVSGIKSATESILKDRDVDIIISLGVISSHFLCHRKVLEKPVIAAVVIDADIQGLPAYGDASGVENLCYIKSFQGFMRDLKLFKEVVPFRKIAVMADSLVLKAIPAISRRSVTAGESIGADVVQIPADTSAEEALDKLPGDIEAVFVTPLVRFSGDEFDLLVKGLIERKQPSFSLMGRDEVEDGIFAGFSPASRIPRLARRIALNVQQILLGENPGNLSVSFAPKEELTINMRTARAIDVYPGWGVTGEAILLFDEPREIKRHITIDEAVREAVSANLDLAAADRELEKGREDIREARSQFLPHLDVSTDGLLIDEDRAEGSMGRNAERSWNGSVKASQLIYSDSAFANLSVQKQLQNSREEHRESLRLDIALETETAYLNLLKAKSNEEIRKNNLKLTIANLERARSRLKIGIGGPSEVYRWESQVAVGRKDVLEATAVRKQAMSALNRILRRPVKEEFSAADARLDNPLFLVSDDRIFYYTNNAKRLKVFYDFIVQEALEASPELRRYDSAIGAQDRIVLASKRAYYCPDIGLQGIVTENFASSGAGTGTTSIPAYNMLTQMPNPEAVVMIPEGEDTSWSVGIKASLPLFTGGYRKAVRLREKAELSRLITQRASLADKIEENTRQALYKISASYPGIDLSKQAASAAKKNLSLVTDSYERGVLSIIDLLDAQNAALVSEQVASASEYDFLIDLMNVQRLLGNNDFSVTREQRELMFEKLDSFFKKSPDIRNRNRTGAGR